jgi:hypothetical protein
MDSARWIALHCGDEAQSLISQHPNAFLLLCQIAMRAKWKDCPITRLKAGQALIGDWHNAGLRSQKAYRHAKKILIDCQFAAFKGASKGTVATLMDTRIFSVSNGTGASVGASKGRARGEQGATNHTDTQKTQIPFALDGTSSDPPRKISWTAESGFSGITDKDHADWKVAYPAVNIPQQIAAASVWLKQHPEKRKSKHGQFLTNWFSRNQERGGSMPSNPPGPSQQVPAGAAVVNGRTYTQKP